MGSIPACAGEPDRAVANVQCYKVYPRVCGGTGVGGSRAQIGAGLSPRVRGNPRLVPQPPRLSRSIPACAGEPAGRPQTGLNRTVYPRVCGGTMEADIRDEDYQGLSPRVRGNRESRGPYQSQEGSIPACAGEPGVNRGCPVDDGVYPRVCGGTSYTYRWRDSILGLSPRVRGNRVTRCPDAFSTRSIPACAGEPS